MIERYQLRYFLAVVDAGSFSRAAVQVNVTQPTLSVGIGKLEAALGAKLFLRNAHRVHLTEAGVRLLSHARVIENEFSGLDQKLAAPRAVRTARLGVLSTIPSPVIAQVVAGNLASPAPDLVEIVEGSERDLVGRLQRGRIDLALSIVRTGETRFAVEPLYSEGYRVAAPAGHASLGQEVVAAESLASETMIVRRHCELLSETSRHFTERGVRPRFSYRSTNDDRVLRMVDAGLGITVMPETYAPPALNWPRLAGFDHRREIGLLSVTPILALDDDSSLLRALRTLRR